jgi:uncharacterized membrane protein
VAPFRPGALRWWGAGGTLVWVAALLGLVAMALVYPIQAAAARTDGFSLPRSQDGTAYMNTDPLRLNLGDAAAIAWVNQPGNVAGDPVIVEAVDAQGGDYTHFSRISAFTGLPAVMGWLGHEWQWRANWAVEPAHVGDLQRRQNDVNQIYPRRRAVCVCGRGRAPAISWSEHGSILQLPAGRVSQGRRDDLRGRLRRG